MKYPPITSWTWHANLLSILSNYEETLPWIYNNYIQLWSDTHGLFFDFWPKSNIIFDCPWLYNQTLKRETIAGMSTNLSQFFVDAIDLDNYIYGIFDESCIAGSLVHQKKSLHTNYLFLDTTWRNKCSMWPTLPLQENILTQRHLLSR